MALPLASPSSRAPQGTLELSPAGALLWSVVPLWPRTSPKLQNCFVLDGVWQATKLAESGSWLGIKLLPPPSLGAPPTAFP